MNRFDQYKEGYMANWRNLVIRPEVMKEVDLNARKILAGRSRYTVCQMRTGVPWFMHGVWHYRESDFNWDTFLGNGQSLHHVTTEVPAHLGPWSTFEDGDYTAMKIQGFVGATDWSIARLSYRDEGMNGYGYHSRDVNSPYLYGGSMLYGRPQSKDGKFVADHKFSYTTRDTQLGTLVILKHLTTLDDTIAFTDPMIAHPPQPDDILMQAVEIAQTALNLHYSQMVPLVVDGRLGKKTMAAVRDFQREHELIATGLLDRLTVDELEAKVSPPGAPAVPKQLNFGDELKAFIEALFKNLEHKP